jgi:hypothetical protein
MKKKCQISRSACFQYQFLTKCRTVTILLRENCHYFSFLCTWTLIFLGPTNKFYSTFGVLSDNSILSWKLFWPFYGDPEKTFANLLRSLDQFIWTEKDQNSFCNRIFFLTCYWRFQLDLNTFTVRTIEIPIWANN